MAPRIKRLPARVEGQVVHFDVSTAAHPDVWAKVDLADWPRVREHRWSATKRRKVLYVRNSKVGLLHRFLIGPDESTHVDHRDGEPLNNARKNIREASIALNNQNRRDRERGYSLVIEKTAIETRPHVVKKRLADGSVKEYVYPTRSKTGTKNLTRRKLGPVR